MFKKMILVAVVGALAVAAFKSTRVGSYVRNEIRSMQEAAEDQVSPEQEIARLRGEVKLLDDDTVKVVKQLARLQSDQAELQARHKALGETRDKVAADMRAQEVAVREAEDKARAGERNVSVTFDKSPYSLDAAKRKLKDTVGRYKDVTKSLDVTQAKLDSQQRIVDKLDAQRLAMGGLKAGLEAAIDELEVEYQGLKLQQMESKYQTDDTRAAQIKEGIAKQRKRLDIQRRELLMLQEGGVVAGSPAVAESVDEIMAGVNGPKGSAAVSTTPAVPPAK